jgi:hypothetical protein
MPEWYEVGSSAQKTVAGITDPAGIFTGLKAAEDADKAAKEAEEKLKGMGGRPQYKANPALLSYYSKNLSGVNNPQGYSAAEKAEFKNNVANTTNTQQNNAIRTSGGNLSRYIAAALNPTTVQANNTFAVNDARLKQSNYNTSMGRLYGAIQELQGIDNRNTGNAYNYHVNTETNLANSVLQNKNYAQDQRDQTGQRVANAIGMVYTMGASGMFGKKDGEQGGVPDVSQEPIAGQPDYQQGIYSNRAGGGMSNTELDEYGNPASWQPPKFKDSPELPQRITNPYGYDNYDPNNPY